MKDQIKIKNNFKKIFFSALFLGVTLFVFGFNFNLKVSAEESGKNDQAQLEKDIIDLTNQEREKEGKAQLKENEILNKAAALKAQDMLSGNYFAHNSTKDAQKDPWYWFDKVNYDYKFAGENLAMDFESAKSVVRAWMKSLTHKENILSDRYTEIGLAVLDGKIDDKPTKIAVQLFGRPLTASLQDKQKELKNHELNDKPEIKKVTIKNWAGEKEDWVIMAEISGDPDKVFLKNSQISEEFFRLSQGKYLKITDSDIEQKIKTETFIIAEKNRLEPTIYKLASKDIIFEKKDLASGLSGSIFSGGQSSLLGIENFNLMNLVMAGFVVICVLMLVNIWNLEREEKSLLEKFFIRR